MYKYLLQDSLRSLKYIYTYTHSYIYRLANVAFILEVTSLTQAKYVYVLYEFQCLCDCCVSAEIYVLFFLLGI